MFELTEEDKKILREQVNKIAKKFCLKQSLSEALFRNNNLRLPPEARLGNNTQGYPSNTGLMLSHYNLHMQPLLLCNQDGDVLKYTSANSDPVPVLLKDYWDISPMSSTKFDGSSINTNEYGLARKMTYYLLKRFGLLAARFDEVDTRLFGYNRDIVKKSFSNLHTYNTLYSNCVNHKEVLEKYLTDINPTAPLKADYFLERTDIGLAINNQVIYKLKLIDITLYFNQLQYNSNNTNIQVNVDGIANYNLLSKDLLENIYSNYPYLDAFTNGDNGKKIIIYKYIMGDNGEAITTPIETINPDKNQTEDLYIFGPKYSWDSYNQAGMTSESTNDNNQFSQEYLDNQKLWGTGRVLYNRLENSDTLTLRNNQNNLIPANKFTDNQVAESLYNQLTDKVSINHPCKIIVPTATLQVQNDGTLGRNIYDWDLPPNSEEVMFLSWFRQNLEEVRGTKYIENFLNTPQNVFVSVSLQDARGRYYRIRNQTDATTYTNALNNNRNDVKNFAVAFSTEGSWSVPNTYQRAGANYAIDSSNGRLRIELTYDDLNSYLSNYKGQHRLGYLNFVLTSANFNTLSKKENFLNANQGNIIYDKYTTGVNDDSMILTIYASDKTSAGFIQFMSTYGSAQDISHHDDRVLEGFKGIIAYYYILKKFAEDYKAIALNNVSLRSYFISTQNPNNINILTNLNLTNISNLYANNNIFNNFLNYIQSSNESEQDINTLKADLNKVLLNCFIDDNLNLNIAEGSPLDDLEKELEIYNLTGAEWDTFKQNLITYITSIRNEAQSTKNCLNDLFTNIITKCDQALTNLETVLNNSLIHRVVDEPTAKQYTANLVQDIYTNLDGEAKQDTLERMINAQVSTQIISNYGKDKKTLVSDTLPLLFNPNMFMLNQQNVSEELNKAKNNLKEHLKQQLKIKK